MMPDTLWQDLSLVLASRNEIANADVGACIASEPCDVDAAVAKARQLIADATCPAVTGLNHVTVEAQRQAVTLAAAHDARVLPDACETPLDIAQYATLGHVYNCDFIIKPGPGHWAAEHPVACAIAERVLHSMFIGETLDDVLQLRAAVRDRGAAALTDAIPQPVRRIAVVLPPGTDVAIVSQWHKLAADVQHELRLCVMTLPAPDAANARGAIEVVTWRTGFAAPVQFADGDATRCLRGMAGVDLAIEIGASQPTNAPQRIVIADAPDASAAVNFTIPGLAIGLAAHVCRFDGQMLRLCDNLQTAPPDPAVALLQRLAGDA